MCSAVRSMTLLAGITTQRARTAFRNTNCAFNLYLKKYFPISHPPTLDLSHKYRKNPETPSPDIRSISLMS